MSSSHYYEDDSIDLQGASHVEGGYACGRSRGNAYKLTDPMDTFPTPPPLPVGTVFVYTSGLPGAISSMSFKTPVTNTFAPVLRNFARKYSPVSG